jgi:hypothetical protein
MLRKLTRDDRRSVADGLIAWGNLVFAALTLGQTVTGIPYKWELAVAGIVFWGCAYAIAVLYMKGGE